jgi:hypothetical protein
MNTTTRRVPEALHDAYNWTDAAGELTELRGLTGEELEAYCRESEANAREHGDTSVNADDLYELAGWLRA